MTKQRKQYSKEFKLEMVKPIEEQSQRVVDIAKQICFNGALYAPYALRPRKCLDWRTPYEVYYQKVLQLV